MSEWKMPSKLVINVTETDISAGIKNNFESCAIVHYINRKYPILTRPTVTDRFIAFSDPTTRTRYTWPTPAKVVEWIQDWDSGNERPIRFTLNTNDALAKPMTQRTVEQKFADKVKAKERRDKRIQELKLETKAQAEVRKETAIQRKKSIRRGKRAS